MPIPGATNRNILLNTTLPPPPQNNLILVCNTVPFFPPGRTREKAAFAQGAHGRSRAGVPGGRGEPGVVAPNAQSLRGIGPAIPSRHPERSLRQQTLRSRAAMSGCAQAFEPRIAPTCCVALGQLPTLSEPQLPLLENEFGNNAAFQDSCAG